MTEELKQAFDEGWRMAAEWANRDDLIPDMDSPHYANERSDRLASLPTQPAAQATPEPRSLREVREDAQRARMMARAAGRTPSAATADFDLPAPNDNAQQATPEPVQLDVVRQAIEERDAMESRYHELAKSMTYKGNSVAWWHSKATAYRNAIDEVWSALKAAGIYADGAKTCADGVRELAATPEPVGEAVAWLRKTDITELVDTEPEDDGWTPLFTRPAPGVPDVEAAAKKLAECMDYPWEHMPSAGRDNMRKHAEAVLAAAQAKGGGHA